MSSPIVIPDGFQYVGAALFSTAVLQMVLSHTVGKHRKLAGIKYPQLYAEKAEAEASPAAHMFNCAQRAHLGTLEVLPTLYICTLLTASRFPVIAASGCAFWTLGRIFFVRGYLTGDPSKRGDSLIYKAAYIPAIGMLGMSFYLSVTWVWEGVSKLF